MTIYEIGDDVNPPPAPVPAPTPVIDDGEYEELGCAVDLADGVRVSNQQLETREADDSR